MTIEFDTSQAEALWQFTWEMKHEPYIYKSVEKTLERRGKRVTVIDYGNNSVLGGVEVTLKNPKM